MSEHETAGGPAPAGDWDERNSGETWHRDSRPALRHRLRKRDPRDLNHFPLLATDESATGPSRRAAPGPVERRAVLGQRVLHLRWHLGGHLAVEQAVRLDHTSVHQTLDPVVEELRGRTLVNLTTTTPHDSRELAAWARAHGIDYLDGAILAVPPMIGGTGDAIFYSGSRRAFDACRTMLDRWAESTYDGEDAGRAALFDLALLSSMYTMFAGFMHGAAMMGSEGVSAGEFATRATAFLATMTNGFKGFAEVIDGGDYTVAGRQSLDFSDLGYLVRASDEQGVNPVPIALVQALIRCQVAAGHGPRSGACLRDRDDRVPR